jgi:hypothetical protein
MRLMIACIHGRDTGKKAAPMKSYKRVAAYIKGGQSRDGGDGPSLPDE